MYISKLFLKEFGKFNNREIKLCEGLNVIYGADGSGKSTIRDFVTGILYGAGKTKGLGSKNDIYATRKPEGGQGCFGKANVTKDGVSYLLERDFRKSVDGAALTDIETGKEKRLPVKNSYMGVLFDMDKSTYEDALCIEPLSEKGDDDKALCDGLSDYLLNIKETGSSCVNRAEAVGYLENERKKYDNRRYYMEIEELEAQMDELGDVDGELESIRQQRRDELDSYNMEIARLKREARRLVNEKDAEIPDEDEDRERSRIFLEVEALDDEPDENEKKKKDKKLTDNIFVIMATGILVVAFITFVVHLVGFQKSIQQLFTICTIAFVAITIIDGLFRKGVFDGDSLPSEEEFQRTIYQMGRATESRTVRVEVDRIFQETHDNKLELLKFEEHDAIEKRNEYYELKEKRDAVFADYDVLETEKKAIDRAIELINGLSDEFGSMFAGLDARISEILGILSNGEFTEAKLDDDMHVAVCRDGHFFRPEYLGRKVVGQVYLAVRLCVASVLGTEKLPLVLDDVVSVTDRESLTNALRAIGTVKTDQIIWLTSDAGVADMIRDMNIAANLIEL